MKTIVLLLTFIFAQNARAQIAVTDLTNLANNRLSQVENVAKWVESITHLRTQIDQLNQQIGIQGDIRQWAGNPLAAGERLVLDKLGATELVRDFGRTKEAVLGAVSDLESLGNTARGGFRAIAGVDLDGNELRRDPLTFRRYAILDALQANTEQVVRETKVREQELQKEIAQTLEVLKTAPTAAEVQKHTAKLNVLNGQLGQVEAARRREVDATSLQKIANDARLEQEKLAAAELAMKDDFLANQRASAYFGTLKLRTR